GPAKAGIHLSTAHIWQPWIPAFAGMTIRNAGLSRCEPNLPLRVLRAAAGLVAAVFLALDDAAVAGQEAAMLQDRAQPRLVKGERLADAVPHRAGLPRQPAARDRAPHVELTEPVGHDKGLADQHAQDRAGK